MSVIKTISTKGLPDAKHIATGRIGKVVHIQPIGMIGDDGTRYTEDMYELAFDGQLWTECFWASEIARPAPSPEENCAQAAPTVNPRT